MVAHYIINYGDAKWCNRPCRRAGHVLGRGWFLFGICGDLVWVVVVIYSIMLYVV